MASLLGYPGFQPDQDFGSCFDDCDFLCDVPCCMASELEMQVQALEAQATCEPMIGTYGAEYSVRNSSQRSSLSLLGGDFDQTDMIEPMAMDALEDYTTSPYTRYSTADSVPHLSPSADLQYGSTAMWGQKPRSDVTPPQRQVSGGSNSMDSAADNTHLIGDPNRDLSGACSARALTYAQSSEETEENLPAGSEAEAFNDEEFVSMPKLAQHPSHQVQRNYSFNSPQMSYGKGAKGLSGYPAMARSQSFVVPTHSSLSVDFHVEAGSLMNSKSRSFSFDEGAMHARMAQPALMNQRMQPLSLHMPPAASELELLDVPDDLQPVGISCLQQTGRGSAAMAGIKRKIITSPSPIYKKGSPIKGSSKADASPKQARVENPVWADNMSDFATWNTQQAKSTMMKSARSLPNLTSYMNNNLNVGSYDGGHPGRNYSAGGDDLSPHGGSVTSNSPQGSTMLNQFYDPSGMMMGYHPSARPAEAKAKPADGKRQGPSQVGPHGTHKPKKRASPHGATPKAPAPNPNGHCCTQCGTQTTPVWRAGPSGPKTLCNACGVRYMKVVKKK